MVDVSIIVVAWNVRDLLYNCLKSAYDQTKGIDFEVIYVDNGSTDSSIEMLTKKFPGITIIQNQKNEGFIKANNQGIKVAKGRYVLLLNSDTIVLDNAIGKIVKFADAHLEAGVVGCKVLNPDKSIQRTCLMYPSVANLFLFATCLYKVFPRSKLFGREHMTWWNYDDVREVEAVCGCFSLVRKEAIDQVGLMDPTYFTYCDEADWCYRFSQSGWKILFTPEPKIIHYGGQNTKHMAAKFRLQLSGSTLIFMKLHRNRLMFPFARFLTALFFFLRVPYWFSMALLHKNERNKSMQTAKAYLVGGFHCLANWKKLLMNQKALEGKL